MKLRRIRVSTKLDRRRARSRARHFARWLASIPPIIERSFIDGLFPDLLYRAPIDPP